jgi:PhnB protein
MTTYGRYGGRRRSKEINMSTKSTKSTRAIPEGYFSVTPFVINRDSARLIEFMKQAFDAVDLGRSVGEDGAVGHAEVRIGDSVVMMVDAKKDWPDTPAFLRLYVEDCDATYARALEAGATSVTRMTNMFWGDRVCRVRDPLGNIWWIQTHIEDVTPEEMERRAGQKEYIEAMQYVSSAQIFPPRR